MQNLWIRDSTPSPTYSNRRYEAIVKPTPLTPEEAATKTARLQLATVATSRMSYPMNLTRQQTAEILRPPPSGTSTHLNSTPSRLLTNSFTYTTPDITQSASRCESVPPPSQSSERTLIYPQLEIDSHLFFSISQPPSKLETYHPFSDLDFPTLISRPPTVIPHPEENSASYAPDNPSTSRFCESENYQYPSNQKFYNCESHLPRCGYHMCGYQSGRNSEFRPSIPCSSCSFPIEQPKRNCLWPGSHHFHYNRAEITNYPFGSTHPPPFFPRTSHYSHFFPPCRHSHAHCHSHIHQENHM
ncbi:hypothetical protein PUN28_008298 [Cardiocondyla obscurior]|uniref:Uncharacterized protein n=1 Tax=Cardiocondyla obscurior TaxID=286306 RepID=A0AAW2FYK8_9HYME